MTLQVRVVALLLALSVAHAQFLRLNCGGPALPGGIVADAARFRSRSTTAVNSFGQGSTTYASHAWARNRGTLLYTLSAPAGNSVRVVLQFQENFFLAFTVGFRRMRVSVNDAVIESNLDVFARVGARKPLDVSRTVVVPSSGVITVKVESLQENSMISGIVLFNAGSATPPPTGSQSGTTLYNVNVGGGALSGGISADSSRYHSQAVGMFKTNGFGKQFSHAFGFGRSPLVYTFPVATGTTVQVIAELAENWSGAFRNGARRLRVLINNAVVESNLDVFARVGANKLFQTTPRTFRVTDGKVVIRVESIVENAYLSGVIIRSVGSTPAQPPQPPTNNPPSTPPTNRQFSEISASGTLPPVRHENGFVFCNGVLYILGGRNQKGRGIWLFNHRTNSWQKRADPQIDMHHFQPVCVGTKIWCPGAWFGNFPNEKTHAMIPVYDTVANTWSMNIPNPPGNRRRGSAAVAVSGTKIYMAAGSSGGHGAPTSLKPFADVLDTAAANPRWVPMTNIPDPRDHTAGAVVGDFFCVAGGRIGSAPGLTFWRNNVGPINCINIRQGNNARWIRMKNLPQPRGGVAVGATCGGYLMIAGGEAQTNTFRGAYNRVDLFDPKTNTFLNPPVRLKRARHGTGLGVTPCFCGKIYIAAGSGSLGGSPELNNIEVWSKNGNTAPC